MKIDAIVNSEDKDKTYPYIGITGNGSLVFFTEPKCGVILKSYSRNPEHKAGLYYYDIDESICTPFQGTLIIK